MSQNIDFVGILLNYVASNIWIIVEMDIDCISKNVLFCSPCSYKLYFVPQERQNLRLLPRARVLPHSRRPPFPHHLHYHRPAGSHPRAQINLEAMNAAHLGYVTRLSAATLQSLVEELALEKQLELGDRQRLMAALCAWTQKLNGDRQWLVTAHNPAVLDGLPLSSPEIRLFAVDRDSNGHTAIKRINLDAALKARPSPEWTLSRMWMNGLLGGAPNV